jgi:thymidylate synthase ThyX
MRKERERARMRKAALFTDQTPLEICKIHMKIQYSIVCFAWLERWRGRVQGTLPLVCLAH